ncbi:MAG: NUDIX domain-containing protein [Bacilli bacterium]|nr:NUDIX domain-containing protein [Bacilli bacterium]
MKPILIITDNQADIPPKIASREAVRGVIVKDGKILLMYSEMDRMYGTPGGGVGLDESKLDALYRELSEEVGAKKVRIISHLGLVEEIRASRSQMGKPFRILSDYYHIEILESSVNSLEQHEEEMGLVPMWMDIDEAIKTNLSELETFSKSRINFYHAQTEVLKYIKRLFEI